MMTNLFSTFNPSNSSNFPINWLAFLMMIFFLPMSFWLLPSRYTTLILLLSTYINSEMMNNISHLSKKMIMMFFSLFWMIFFNNSLGLFPYIFTSTSHLTLSLSLSLPSWMSLMIFGWLIKSNHMFSHLVPMNTPLALASFMVMIETTSNLIRPLTLAVRLSANMIAGHLLLSLLSEISEKFNFMFFLSMPFLTMLILLEFAVAFIQSYVFITLISLYLTEVN